MIDALFTQIIPKFASATYAQQCGIGCVTQNICHSGNLCQSDKEEKLSRRRNVGECGLFHPCQTENTPTHFVNYSSGRSGNEPTQLRTAKELLFARQNRPRVGVIQASCSVGLMDKEQQRR